MKIATFNINNVSKGPANLLDWRRKSRPEVACLQELKVTDSEFPEGPIIKAGYKAVWRGQKSWNRVPILRPESRAPFSYTASCLDDPRFQLAVHSVLQLPLLPCNH